MKPFDVKSNTYIDSSKEINNKNPKFKSGDIVRISKQKTFFAKCCVLNWSEEVFVIKRVKNTVPWTCYYQESDVTFYKKRITKNQSNRIWIWKSNQKKKG